MTNENETEVQESAPSRNRRLLAAEYRRQAAAMGIEIDPLPEVDDAPDSESEPPKAPRKVRKKKSKESD